MAEPADLVEIDKRIAIIRDNIRELMEQAAAYSGAADEGFSADRVAQQEEQLTALLAERDRLSGSNET